MRRLWPASKYGASKAQLPTREKQNARESTLWSQAYQKLGQDDRKLMEALESLLRSHQSDPSSSHSSSDGHQQTAASASSIDFSHEPQISKFIETRLAIMNERKWRVKLGKHSLEIREQVDRIIKIILVAKDFVSSAASMDPVHAGLPWAGICALLPLLINDSKQRSLAIDGLEYIAKIIRRYAQIERLYLEHDPSRVKADLETNIIMIYRLILEFEAKFGVAA